MAEHEPLLAEETVGADEPAVVAEFIDFLKTTSAKHHPTGVVPRFNQGRAAGCVAAEFIVPGDLAPGLRVGLFATPATYAARIRFASATSKTDRDPDVRGMAIKLSGIDGHNLTDGETCQDFVLNSHPVMMVGGTRTFLQLLKAVEAGGVEEGLFFVKHPHAAAVALSSRRHATSHLEIPYWSTTPYLFGSGRAVKYIVRPLIDRTTPAPVPLTDTYLRDRLVAHLKQHEAWFEFCVQFQIDGRVMPIEDASVEWQEDDSPYRPVARIRIPIQDADSPDGACDRLSFNPWHALPEHRPLGDYNRARREIYRAMAEFRSERWR